MPSAREFLHEFLGHYVALEGKLWGTLWRLIFRPGLLTNEYIAGRRVRYVEPLRVYLTMSILFFALIRLPGMSVMHTQETEPPAKHAAVASAIDKATLKAHAPVALPKQGEGAVIAAKADEKDLESDPDEAPAAAGKAASAESADKDGESLLNYVGGYSQPLKQRLKHAMSLPQEEQWKLATEGFFHYAPYAMFCLMSLAERKRSSLTDHAERLAKLTLEILKLWHGLQKRFKGKIDLAQAVALNDIKAQLSQLVYPGFVRETPAAWLKELPRYLKAIELRFEKLGSQVQKDGVWSSELGNLRAQYQARAGKPAQEGKRDAELVVYRWWLEEYRVSLFGQQLGTKVPISDKRLSKQWSQVEG